MRQPTSKKDVEFSRVGWLKDRFRYLDMFGTTVNFTYDTDEVYKTHEGATVTVLIVLTLLIVTGTQLKNMISRSEKILLQSVEYNDLSVDIQPFSFENSIPVYYDDKNWLSFFQKKDAINMNFQFAFYFMDDSGAIIDYDSLKQYLQIKVTKKRYF